MRRAALILLSTLACACAVDPPAPSGSRTAGDILIVDTHIDAPFRLHRRPADLSLVSPDGQFDGPRARAGGLTAGFMSIFIPPDVEAAGEGLSLANRLIDIVEGLAQQHPDTFTRATCPNDVVEAHRRGLIALPMGMENGGLIGEDLDLLRQIHARGVRYVGLAHSKSNALADSSYDKERPWQGLSQAGRAVIREMNTLGMLVDVSHLSDDAFWHVLDESAAPVIASHSSARHFIRGFERNIDDRMVTAVTERGGVVQINVGSGFLTQAARDYEEALMAAAKAEMLARHLKPEAPQMKDFVTRYRSEHPYPFAMIADVIDHIDHVVQLGGINGVGIGSDFDGVGDTLPSGLKSVADYPNLIEGLRQRGYSERAIRKVMGENLLRVWRTALRHASEHGTRPQCIF